MREIGRRFARVGVLALALGLVGVRAAGAQLLRGAVGYVGAGASSMATGALDDRLEARGYPAFGSAALGLVLGGYRLLPGGVMLGGEWNGLVLGEETHQGREVGIGGGYGTLGVGYAVEISPRARVYPRIGLGGGGMGVWIDSVGAAVRFDEVLASPKPAPNRLTVLSRGSMVVDLGGGAELRAGRRGPLIGLRAGYLAAPLAGDWRLEGEWSQGEPVSVGPDATIAGPYLRVMVGWALGG